MSKQEQPGPSETRCSLTEVEWVLEHFRDRSGCLHRTQSERSADYLRGQAGKIAGRVGLTEPQLKSLRPLLPSLPISQTDWWC